MIQQKRWNTSVLAYVDPNLEVIGNSRKKINLSADKLCYQSEVSILGRLEMNLQMPLDMDYIRKYLLVGIQENKMVEYLPVDKTQCSYLVITN